MISPLGSRYAIGGALGRSVKRASGGGWWDLNGSLTSCVAAYQPKGAASFAASKINLANPGNYNVYQIYGSQGWSADNGWTPSANNMRMVTEAPIDDIDNRTIIYSGKKRAYGYCFHNNDNNRIWHNYNYFSYARNASATKTTFTIDVNSNYIIALNANGIWLNGTFLGAGTLGSESTDATTVIGCNKSGGIGADQNVYAFAIYDVNLTSSQISALSTAMAAL